MKSKTEQEGAAGGGGRARAAFRLDGMGKRAVARAMVDIVRLAGPQRWPIIFFIGLYFLASFIQTGGLLCLYAGSSTVGADQPAHVHWAIDWLVSGLRHAGVPQGSWWVVFFTTFALLSIGAVALDHLGWVVRLRLLSVYEANQMRTGLRVICNLDPRERASISRREMLYAVRGDCKSMRVVFQLLLLISVSLTQTVFPFALILSMDALMTALGLAVLLLGFYPIYLLGKRAARMTFSRQDAAIEAGSRVSRMISSLQKVEMTPEQKDQAVEEIARAVANQHVLWRQQYQIRSLCEKIPTWFAVIGTFAVLLVGVVRINLGTMDWATLLTIVVAVRVVFAPFSSIGNRSAKTSEHLPRAMRHLEFARRFSGETHSPRQALPEVGSHTRVDSIQVRALPLARQDTSLPPGLNLDLRPGDVLTLVDPAMDLDNPLFRLMSGKQYVAGGDILFNGISVNSIRYESLQRAFCNVRVATDGVNYDEGTILEVMRIFRPNLTRPEGEEFALNVMGPDLYATAPRGLDTLICYARRKENAVPRACFWLVTLFRKLNQPGCILLVDTFKKFDDDLRAMTERFVARYRHRFIVLWMDRQVRPQVPEQTVVAFRNGLWMGTGDLAWFSSRLGDWSAALTQPVPAEAVDEETEALVQEIEEESLDEDL